jgi:hypothetical protein
MQTEGAVFAAEYDHMRKKLSPFVSYIFHNAPDWMDFFWFFPKLRSDMEKKILALLFFQIHALPKEFNFGKYMYYSYQVRS